MRWSPTPLEAGYPESSAGSGTMTDMDELPPELAADRLLLESLMSSTPGLRRVSQASRLSASPPPPPPPRPGQSRIRAVPPPPPPRDFIPPPPPLPPPDQPPAAITGAEQQQSGIAAPPGASTRTASVIAIHATRVQPAESQAALPETAIADDELPAEIADPLPDSGFWNSVRTISTSTFASFALHLAILLGLAFWFNANQQRETPPEETVTTLEVTNLEPEPELTEAVSIETLELLAEAETEDSSLATTPLQELASASSADQLTMVDVDVALPTSPADANGTGTNGLAALGNSQGTGTGDAAGNGQGTKKGDGRVGFFGSTAEGMSFVFIVDCSGSMNTLTAPAPRLPQIPRFRRAVLELYSALGQLGPKQSFHVMLYNHTTFPMYFPRGINTLVPASPQTVTLTRNWLGNSMPMGGTDPREALKLALQMQPDVIFLLTDGEIPDESRAVALQFNQESRSAIHTIAIGGGRGSRGHQILRQIAADNRGRFRWVP